MQTLKDLLEQAKLRHGGVSGRALADLTSKREHKVDRTQVNAILAGTYKHKPTPSLVKAIAWLAGVDEPAAFRAARLPVPGPPFAQELPPDVDLLTPQQRHAVITMIRAFLGSAEVVAPQPGDVYVDGLTFTADADDGHQLSDEERERRTFDELVSTVATEMDTGRIDVAHVRTLLVYLTHAEDDHVPGLFDPASAGDQARAETIFGGPLGPADTEPATEEPPSDTSQSGMPGA